MPLLSKKISEVVCSGFSKMFDDNDATVAFFRNIHRALTEYEYFLFNSSDVFGAYISA